MFSSSTRSILASLLSAANRRLLLLTLVVAQSACAHKATVVRRVEANTQVDLSGHWNDTDAHLTSEALIYECFAAPWLPAFQTRESRRPAVRVGSVTNQTDEHIDAQMFIKNIERAMINSGKVQVLAQSGRESDAVAAEAQRNGYRPPSQAALPAPPGQLGADYVGAVRLSATDDEVEGKQVRLYKINFELLDVTSGEKAWLGDFEVKKLISRGRWKL